MKRHGMAVALALLFAALVAAGCGLGPGSGVKDAELTVTREYGTVPVLHRQLGDLTESDTVMRALERNADITTRYGGGFVQSIEGVEADESVESSSDWFFYVNGVESTIGAADYSLHGGESIWWDYRNWSAAMQVPAVVGSWPEPFLDGYDGESHPVAVECLGGGSACGTVIERLQEAGVEVASGSPSGAIRVLVGPWAQVRQDPDAAQVEDGPQASGVFAKFHREKGAYHLDGLEENGNVRFYFGAASGLVAATRRHEGPPVWMVTGETDLGVRTAASHLDAAELHGYYAVAFEGEKATGLPVFQSQVGVSSR
jgi:hypothetical protein